METKTKLKLRVQNKEGELLTEPETDGLSTLAICSKMKEPIL